MTVRNSPLHFVVYDRGKPWKTPEVILHDYSVVFNGQPYTEDTILDLTALELLRGDSFDYVVTTWDGRGGTPPWLWKGFGAQRIVFISKSNPVL